MNRIACFTYCLLLTLVTNTRPVRAFEETAADPLKPTAQQIEFFEKQVRPLLAEHCFKCHSAKAQKGELRLDSRAGMLKGGETGPAFVPFHPEDSEFILAINYDPAGYQMPPTGKLNDAQIAVLTEWVRMGGPWPGAASTTAPADAASGFDLDERAQHWSLQPVRKSLPPDVAQADWPRTPVDRFILQRLEQAGLPHASEADKRTLIRRLTYDLIGLPPTPAEIDAFLADAAPDAYECLVERLLASPHYGERWGRHWLDLVRYSETAGHEFDYDIPHASPYRDYVIRAFNDDLPYDQFVTEHIAGDLLPEPRINQLERFNESVIATAFYWLGQGKHSPVDIRAEECDTIDNQIDVLSKTFLGMTVACARCHDHKFDAIRAADYYALAGYLQSSRQQMAILDLPEDIDQFVRPIRTLQSLHRDAFIAVTADRLSARLTATEAWLDSRQEDARLQQPDHPLHAWRELGTLGSAEEFGRRKQQLIDAMSAQTMSAQTATANVDITDFEDFRDSPTDRWIVTGPAFADSFTQGGELILDAATDRLPIQQVIPAGEAHGGLVTGRLRGDLRSTTFDIEQRYIHYRMRRVGGPASPGRGNKNGQANLIVDGFQFIRDPLYGLLSINVAHSDEFRWYRQDVGKFLGERAYIEFLDEDDGYLVVDKIVFSDSDTPPGEESNSLLMAALKNPAVNSRETLAEMYQALLTKSIERWLAGGLVDDSDANDHFALLNVLLDDPRSEARSQPHPAAARVRETVTQIVELEAQIQPPRLSIAMVDGSGENEHILVRGNHKKPGEEVPRRFLEALGGLEQPVPTQGSGRLQLAQQMVDPDNPLTARVFVNRIWHHHFGRGIVPTPDDFGKMGQPPTHPELLDFLAAELMEHGWSIKWLHRLIVTSSVYRMSSQPDEAVEPLDPQNVWLHRMPVRRLEAEAVRDAILAVSGRLDHAMFGPSVALHLTAFMEGRGRPGHSGPLDGAGRRSIYINVRRNFLTPMFLAFDYPTPLSTMGRRSVSNVPAQALTMMNNPLIVEQTGLWARNMLQQAEPNANARIENLYLTAFGRLPTDAEIQAALGFLAAQGADYGSADDPRAWADLCHVLVNVKEFLFIP